MNAPLPLPALDGRTPLGFLAALGVLRLLTDHHGRDVHLSWSTQDSTAVLHDADTDMNTLVEDLASVVAAIPGGGVLPGAGVNFPPPGEAPDKLRLARPAFTAYAQQVSRDEGPDAERWLASLVTDLSVDKDGRVAISLYNAPSGKQSTRTMFTKSLDMVRKDPALLREALVAWRRYPNVTGEYLDHRVLFDAVDAPDGKPTERGVPGATWLALMAYPLLRTTAIDGQPMSTCWQQFGRKTGRRMVYPLWSAPLDMPAIHALLSHPVLAGAEPGRPPQLAALLSIFWIVHARRQKIPGRNFAGVLVPEQRPAHPTPPPRRTR